MKTLLQTAQRAVATTVALLSATCFAAEQPFTFRNATETSGLLAPLAGMQGHGAGWGDIDGDGLIDLYVGTFHKKDAKPAMLFRNLGGGKFEQQMQEPLALSAQITGVVFADLDNDGDLDLYVASMPKPTTGLAGCTLFENDGKGTFKNIAESSGACPEAFGGRSVAVLDYNGDGLLDLLVGEDFHPGYNGSMTKSSRLFKNLGGLKFTDASAEATLPSSPGLGVCVGDFNNDGWPDLFLASSEGGNVLCINDGKGHFSEPAGAREVFAWKDSGGDNMVCGVACADVNRDGLLDLVLGQHYDSPWKKPVSIRLYLNRGIENGVPRFEDHTNAAGLVPLPLKAPHVEIQDMDNDGWPDIVTSFLKLRDGVPHPVIFHHTGVMRNGVPRFEAPALAVNDFPTDADRAIGKPAKLFEKILAEKTAIYMAAAPTGDYDNDGRLDMFLPSWFRDGESYLLHNETAGGHWLNVRVEGAGGVNRMGTGSRVKIYRAGHAGELSALLGCREIAVGFGYASGQPAIAHFGLGDETMVDVEITLPHNRGTILEKGVAADTTLTKQSTTIR